MRIDCSVCLYSQDCACETPCSFFCPLEDDHEIDIAIAKEEFYKQWPIYIEEYE